MKIIDIIKEIRDGDGNGGRDGDVVVGMVMMTMRIMMLRWWIFLMKDLMLLQKIY